MGDLVLVLGRVRTAVLRDDGFHSQKCIVKITRCHQIPCARNALRACAAQSRLARGLAGLGWRTVPTRTERLGNSLQGGAIGARAGVTRATGPRPPTAAEAPGVSSGGNPSRIVKAGGLGPQGRSRPGCRRSRTSGPRRPLPVVSLCRPAPSVTPCDISGLRLLIETSTAQFS